MKKLSKWMAAPVLTAVMALGVETKVWTQSEAQEFDKGKLKGLALSSDGRLTLGPVWKELADAGTAHLWSAAADAKGNVYAGGAEGKVFSVDDKGKLKTLATLEGGAVYALAVEGGAVYAAVSPEAKVYKIEGGKAKLHAELKARYVWALVKGEGGVLYAATGDPGQIQRIDGSGKATVVFDAGETHVRSLAADGKGNLIAGTEPGGVVLRVNAKGEGFVLHQTGKREVTAVVVGPDGSVYAAATGTRTPVAPVPVVAQTVTPAPPAGQAAVPAGQAQAARPVTAVPPAIGVTAAGGSEVYRILSDGEPRRMWVSALATVYALALDGNGKVIVATGNQGRVYRIDNEFTVTRLVEAEPQQVTALAALSGGGVAAVTANPGKVFQLGPKTVESGTVESDVLDAGAFTYWGRLRHEGELKAGELKLEARSGNVERPGEHWSAWSALTAEERIQAPAARYLQWRATLSGGSLRLVEAAYQAKNQAPVLERVEITPANYRFPAPGSGLTASNTLSLPAMGAPRKAAGASVTASETGAATLTFDQGWLGARWKAGDANGDALEYKVEIRGVEEKEWKPLKEKLKESRMSWDGSGYADGQYVLKVTASDQNDNYPGQGLTAVAESDAFPIDNTAPEIEGLEAKVEGGRIAVKFAAKDSLTALESAEFSVNGGAWMAARPATGITDSLRHEYAVGAEKPAGTEFTVAVRVTDERQNTVVKKVTVR